MKTCLIPPVPELRSFGHGSMHLILSHLLHKQDYFEHYKSERAKGAYIILDNGAHETTHGASGELLLQRAVRVRASEIVLPDTLFSNEDTVARTTKALAWMTLEGRDDLEALRPRLMLVPQGNDAKSWQTCLQSLLWTYDRYWNRHPDLLLEPVIGISKDYEVFDDGIPNLLEKHVMPVGYDVHLLGWGRNLWVLAEMAERWPQLRSTDSAKPFVYALNNISLDASGPPPEYPKRPRDYFELSLTPEQREIAFHNVGVFSALACS